jgi:hypothetical protein
MLCGGRGWHASGVHQTAVLVYEQQLLLKTLREASDLDSLRPEWDQLLAESTADSAFLSWDWVRAWWAVYGDPSELSIVEARTAEGRLVGLAPLKISRRLLGRRVVGFLGQGGGVTPEYLDFVVKSGWEAVAIPAMLRSLVAESGVRKFDLRTIPAQSPTVEIILRTLEQTGVVRQTEHSRCPLIR